MTHSHDHSGEIRNVGIAFILNFVFTLIEIAGGLWTNSTAVLADALHDLGDSLSIGLAFIMERLSGKERDEHFSYGYGRFSLLSAVINGIVLISGSVIILVHAVPRIIDPPDVNPQGMILLAVMGIVFNGIGVLLMKRGRTVNQQMLVLHLLEDLLGWASLLIISIVMAIWYLPVLDPVFSVIYTLVILFNVGKLLYKTIKLFLQGIPPDIDIIAIEKRILSLEGIEDVHDIHVWSLNGRENILSLHVAVGCDIPREEFPQMKDRIRNILSDESIAHSTIEIDIENENCSFRTC
ncbi:MAG: cation diffusion facilitator family transporter [candidate division WOR-3 bacterium]|nr:cation diffusion facilitator family transporter [candidate division WOR-3 bacterium]